MSADESTVKIYVTTHRHRVEVNGDSGYVPIQGGKALSSDVFADLGDDSGDNISHLNPYFNENTAIYWMCRNAVAKADYLGLAHYRRFFAAKSLCTIVDGQPVAASADFTELYDGQVDMIVGHPLNMINPKTDTLFTLEQNYAGCHVGFDLFVTRQVLKSIEPEYIEAFDFAMRNGELVPYNIFVGRRRVVEEYAAWLFPILMQLNERIPFNSYEDPYQRRAIAFLSERLFTVWVVQNRYRIKFGYRHATFNAHV